jgi:hypothetical protein
MDDNKVWATVLAEDNNSEHLVLPNGYPSNYRPDSMLYNTYAGSLFTVAFYPRR